jgi:hypothetical protein
VKEGIGSFASISMPLHKFGDVTREFDAP